MIVLFLPFIIAYGISYKFKNFKQKVVPFLVFILLFVAIGTWWFIYVRWADPKAFLAIAARETGNWSSYNVKPFYYYWSFFIQSGLWTIPAFIGLLYPYIIKRVENKKAYQFTFLWTIIAVVLLSVIPEKKARYLMPVLIPLALNTGFYIQYLIKSFSKITNKKETIPVYFNFGLIAAIGVSFPVILYFILKKDIQLYLYNYISTSVVLLVIGVLMFKYLVAKNLKNVFYLSILLMASILVFAIPISKIFNKNENYNALNNLHKLENSNHLTTFSIGEITPEMLWDYNGKIKNIYENDIVIFPLQDQFGLLVPPGDIERVVLDLKQDYNYKLIATYNANVGSKQKDRLIREYYHISKK